MLGFLISFHFPNFRIWTFPDTRFSNVPLHVHLSKKNKFRHENMSENVFPTRRICEIARFPKNMCLTRFGFLLNYLSDLVYPESRLMGLGVMYISPNHKMRTFRILGKWKSNVTSSIWSRTILQSFWTIQSLIFKVKMDLQTPADPKSEFSHISYRFPIEHWIAA